MNLIDTKKPMLKRISIASFILLTTLSLTFISFRPASLADDFLAKLGLTRSDADNRIKSSILGGSLNYYGIKNAKNIAAGSREAVILDLLQYTKKYVSGAAYIKEYQALKMENKPEESKAQTPEEMKAEQLANVKKSIAETQAALKTADASMKPIFQNVLNEMQKNLKEVEDPQNKQYLRYAKNYHNLVKTMKESHESNLALWEKKYPANHLLFVKARLQEFMKETADIDFDAVLVSRNGKKYFEKAEYERKSSRWKMAFRAGKEVVLPARRFVQQWIDEIQ